MNAAISGDRTKVIDLIMQETRWAILEHLLENGEATLSDLSSRLGCTRQNVHHHLKRLEESGLAHVVEEEETNGLPRHYWGTELGDMFPDGSRVTPMDLTRLLVEKQSG